MMNTRYYAKSRMSILSRIMIMMLVLTMCLPFLANLESNAIEDCTYKEETAWGKGCILPNEFSDVDPKLKNWGWTNGPYEKGGTYYLDLYAGAGGNDTTKGLLVGAVAIVYNTDGSVVVTYYSDYEIMEAHLWVGDTPLPMIDGKYKNAPGQFPDSGWYHDSGQNNGEYFYVFHVDENFTGPIYVAAHAVVMVPDTE